MIMNYLQRFNRATQHLVLLAALLIVVFGPSAGLAQNDCDKWQTPGLILMGKLSVTAISSGPDMTAPDCQCESSQVVRGSFYYDYSRGYRFMTASNDASISVHQIRSCATGGDCG